MNIAGPARPRADDRFEAGYDRGIGSDVRIPPEVAAVLRYYVYALRDPRDGKVFYVGKGVGDRINARARGE